MTGTNGESGITVAAKTTTTTTTTTTVDDREIGRENLQLMLRPKLGERVLVTESRQAALLPPGENFACSIYKIDAHIEHLDQDKDKDEQELHFVAKLFPHDDYIRNAFDFTVCFTKEIFFYERLLPVIKGLAKEFIARNDDNDNYLGAFDFAPELYGTRLSTDSKAKEVDDGVVVLMDNLNCKGYYTGSKIEGLDLKHSRATITSLARFHASVIGCKQHRKDFFETEVRAHAKALPYNEDENVDLFQLLLGMMFSDERFVQHRERIVKFLGGPETKRKFYEYVAEEPWLGITHFDFWTNNVLFKQDERGDVADVKFIDFQNYTYNSPLRDLPYFLCTSTSHEVMTRHLDELLDLYYETFVATLKKLRCDAAPFTRDSFDEQLKIDAGLEFFHNVLAIKFFCAEIDKNTYEPSQLPKVVLCSQINKLGLDKWYQIVLAYIKHGWM